MDLNVFRQISSTDNEVRNTAVGLITEQFENMDFLVFLMEALKQNTTSDMVLLNGLCISLLEMLRRTVKRIGVFNQEAIEYMKQSLIELLGSVPMVLRRQYILECMKCLMNKQMLNWDVCVSKCLEVMAANNDFGAVATAGSFMVLWVELCVKPTREFEEPLKRLSEAVMPLLFNCLSSAVSSLSQQHSDEVVEFMSDCAKIFGSLLVKCSNIFMYPNFADMIRIFGSTMHITVRSNAVSQAKMAVVSRCFIKLIEKYGRDECLVSPDERPFCMFFKAEIAPFLVECCFNGINHVGDPVGINAILLLVLKLIEKRLQPELLLTPALLMNLLLPASLLSEDDMQTMDDIPEQYVYFCLVPPAEREENVETADIPRKTISMIIKKLPPEYVIAAMEPLTVMEESAPHFEAKVFIIAMIFMYHKKYLNTGPIFDMATAALGATPPPFLAASLLRLLFEGHSEESQANCCIVACEYLINYPHAVVKWAASALWEECFDSKKGMVLSHPLEALIQTLFGLSNCIREKSIGLTLEKMIQIAPDQSLSIAKDLIFHIMELWGASVCSGSDDHTFLLPAVSRAIDGLPDDSPVLSEIAVPLIDMCIKGLQLDDCESGKQLFDIIEVVCEKVEPEGAFFSIIGVIGEFLSSNDNDMYIIEATPVITKLIGKSHFMEAEGALPTVLTLCDFGLGRWTEKSPQCDDYTVCVLKIMISILEHCPLPEEIVRGITARGMVIMEANASDQLTVWAIGVIATAVRVSHGGVIDQITEAAVQKWCSGLDVIRGYGLSLVRMSSLGLLTMAITAGNPGLLLAHAQQTVPRPMEDGEEGLYEEEEIYENEFAIEHIDFKAEIRAMIHDKMEFIQTLPAEIGPLYLQYLSE